MPAGVIGLDEPLLFEAVSVSPAPPHVLAARAAAVLDAAGPLAPDRAGLSSRTALVGHGGVSAVAEGIDVGAGGWLVFERRSLDLWGDLRVFGDTRLSTAPRLHSVSLRLPLGRALVEGRLDDALLGLMGDLFGAVGCFYGSADTAALRRRRQDLRTAAAERGDMWLPDWDDPLFLVWDRWVEDVWWVNLFGRAYVRRWGAERIGAMGVGRDLPCGGVLVIASEQPPDPLVSDSISGYPHKRAAYEALGLDTFIHESTDVPERGALVPTLAVHARQEGHPG